MVGSILEGARSIEVVGDALTIRLARGMESLARQLQRKENLELLVEHASRLFGRTLRILVEHEEEAETPGIAASEPAPAPAAKPARVSKGEDKHGSLVERAKGEPGVSKLLRDFGAQVVDIRPDPET
jgi:hypothetical protein